MSDIQRRRVVLKQPFDLDVTVDSWVYPDVQPTPELKRPAEFGRCFSIKGSLIPIRVLQKKKGIHSLLEVQYPCEFADLQNSILSTIEWVLGWDVDTRPVLAAINADPIISHLGISLEGLRPFSQPSLFEAMVKAVLQQQVSYRSANQVIRRLVLAYGPQCNFANLNFYGFPRVEELALLSEAELRACKFGYKAPYLVELFKQLKRGTLQLDVLVNSDSKHVIQVLDTLPGIGVWTAELAVLTGLRRLDVFPADDLGVRQIVSKLYLDKRPAKRKDVEAVAKRWGEAGALVLYFLMCAQVLGLV